MTGIEVVAALAAIVTIVYAIDSIENRANDLQTKALGELSNAVTATEKYISIEAKKSAHREVNYDLTNAWHRASLAFRDAGDYKMQKLCSIKGDYWLDPAAWTEDSVVEASIKLSEMRNRLNSLLTIDKT